jgi:hypothetical protein
MNLKYSFVLLLVALLMVVAGCSRKGVASTTSEVFDSTFMKEEPRIVEVKIPGDTVTIERFIECDPVTNKPIPFHEVMKSKRASVTVDIDASGRLNTTGVCDSLIEAITAMDKEVFHLKRELKKETIIKTEYKTRRIDTFCRWFTGIVMILALGLVFYKLNQHF